MYVCVCLALMCVMFPVQSGKEPLCVVPRCCYQSNKTANVAEKGPGFLWLLGLEILINEDVMLSREVNIVQKKKRRTNLPVYVDFFLKRFLSHLHASVTRIAAGLGALVSLVLSVPEASWPVPRCLWFCSLFFFFLLFVGSVAVLVTCPRSSEEWHTVILNHYWGVKIQPVLISD